MPAEPPLITAVCMFYASAALAMWSVWALLSVGAGCKDVHRRSFSCPLAHRPTRVPRPVLQALLQSEIAYLSACHVAPACLLLAAFAPDNRGLRLLAALVMSLYNLLESSVTHSHRDYANCYTAWALALLPDQLAQGVALGSAVHLIAASGFSKLFIGGLNSWLSPSTLSTVLRAYGDKSLTQGGPAFPAINRMVRGQPWLVLFLAGGTLLFECVIIPASLICPPEWRFWMVVLSVKMHLGIALMQSLIIGVAFLPNIATYLFGFGWIAGSGAELFSLGWCCAVAIFLGATMFPIAVRGTILPEDWPFTPFALFAWSGKQWDVLFATFSSGQTRLVLAPDDTPVKKLLGRSVLSHWGATGPGEGILGNKGRSAYGSDVVFDAWEQLVGETLVHGTLLPAFDFDAMAKGDSWDARPLIKCIELWLQRDQKLFEIRSGQLMSKAYFVRVQQDGLLGCKVTDVIASI